jgi:hypothetical protein
MIIPNHTAMLTLSAREKAVNTLAPKMIAKMAEITAVPKNSNEPDSHPPKK